MVARQAARSKLRLQKKPVPESLKREALPDSLKQQGVSEKTIKAAAAAAKLDKQWTEEENTQEDKEDEASKAEGNADKAEANAGQAETADRAALVAAIKQESDEQKRLQQQLADLEGQSDGKPDGDSDSATISKKQSAEKALK